MRKIIKHFFGILFFGILMILIGSIQLVKNPSLLDWTLPMGVGIFTSIMAVIGLLAITAQNKQSNGAEE